MAAPRGRNLANKRGRLLCSNIFFARCFIYKETVTQSLRSRFPPQWQQIARSVNPAFELDLRTHPNRHSH